MKRISILACILVVCFVSTAWAQPATKPPIGRHLTHRIANQASRTPDLAASRSFHAQAADSNPAAAPAGRNGYSFQTIDVPFGQPGVDMDMQCLYRSDSGTVVAQYQIPRSGACCGGPGFTENDHTAVLRRGTWTNIDVPGALTTVTSNPNEQGQVALTYKFADGVWHVAIQNHRGLTPIPAPPSTLAESMRTDSTIVAWLPALCWTRVGNLTAISVTAYTTRSLTTPERRTRTSTRWRTPVSP